MVDRDLDRRLADRRQDRLVSRILAPDVEGRVLVGELVQRRGELVQVGFARRLDGDRKGRRRELDRGVEDHSVLVRQGCVRRRGGQLGDRADVPGADYVRHLLLLAAEEEDLADALGLLLCRVVDRRVVVQRPRVDPDVAQLSDERVGERLEDERGQLVGRVRLARDLLA